MTNLTVSPSGTGSLSQLINIPPKSFATPSVVGDGSVHTQDVDSTETKANVGAALLRAFSPEAVPDDLDGQTAGRFVDVKV